MHWAGHSGTQAPQAMHSSVILYAMTPPSDSVSGLYGFHPLDGRNPLLEGRLDAPLQRHRGHRAAAACAREAHLHHATVYVDEFHVSPIGLEGGANAVQHFLDFWSHRYTSSVSCRIVNPPP